MQLVFDRLASTLEREAALLEWARSPLLLAIRLYWGWQFALTGWGKLGRIEQVAAWFGGDLGIPMPLLNAYMAAGTELVGGVCLLLGLGARIVTIPLAFTMCVAYATSDREALLAIATDPDAFVSAGPFLFLLASLLVLVFGPGALSLDEGIRRAWRSRAQGQPATA